MGRRRTRSQEYEADGRYADPLHPEWLEHPLPLRFWQDRENHKRYLRWLGRQLGYRRWEDWYRVRLRDFVANHGVSLISNYYRKCPVRAVAANFPQYDWKEWLFHIAPNGFWDDPANRRRYMRWLGQQLGFAKLDDWYRVTERDFEQHRGEGLLKQFRGSPVAAVKDAFPGHDWKEWQFTLTPKRFWAVWQNRRRYMDWLGRKLRYKRPEDWYGISLAAIKQHGGGGMMYAVYGASPVAAVMDCYPEHDWKEWLFPFVPVGFWRKLENRRRYLKWLEGELGFSGPEDWYQVTQPDFFRNCGTGLLNGQYRSSVLRAVRELYPDYEWCEWLFRGPPKGLWKQPAVRRRYLSWLAKQLKLRRPAEWYRVTPQDFQNHGGGHLLRSQYGGSVCRAAKELRPGFGWRPEHFEEHAGSRQAQARR